MTFPSHGIQKSYPLIDITATVAHSPKVSGAHPLITFVPDDKTTQRVKDLGLEFLQTLFESNEQRVFTSDQTRTALENIERAMRRASGQVKTKRFGRYNLNDVENAIKFLELFSIYAAQKKATEVWLESGASYDTGKEIEKNKSFKDPAQSPYKDYVEKNVFQAVHELEVLAESPRRFKDNAALGKLHIEALSKSLKKIYNLNLSVEERESVAKSFLKALKVLNTYYS